MMKSQNTTSRNQRKQSSKNKSKIFFFLQKSFFIENKCNSWNFNIGNNEEAGQGGINIIKNISKSEQQQQKQESKNEKKFEKIKNIFDSEENQECERRYLIKKRI